MTISTGEEVFLVVGFEGGLALGVVVVAVVVSSAGGGAAPAAVVVLGGEAALVVVGLAGASGVVVATTSAVVVVVASSLLDPSIGSEGSYTGERRRRTSDSRGGRLLCLSCRLCPDGRCRKNLGASIRVDSVGVFVGEAGGAESDGSARVDDGVAESTLKEDREVSERKERGSING